MGFEKVFEKFVKNMKWYDISLIKGAIFFFTLFLIAVWPAFHNLVMNIHWGWFLIIGVLFAIRPWMKMFW